MQKARKPQRRYFVRSGGTLRTVTARNADHAVHLFLRQCERLDLEFTEFVGISRRGHEDPNMFWALTTGHLEPCGPDEFVVPRRPPCERDDPPEMFFDGRMVSRGPRKPPKDKHARWRHRMAAAGRCPRCGDPAGNTVLCNYCRWKKLPSAPRKKHAPQPKPTPTPKPHPARVPEQTAERCAPLDTPPPVR